MTYSTTQFDIINSVDDEPSFTCPKIDKVQRELSSIAEKLNAAVEIVESLSDENMEEIRNANSDIRAWGNQWKDKALELQAQIDELNDNIKEKDQEIEDLKREVKSLERETA
jgi:uncharacterized coiled-coil DUF342 family protein